MSNVLRPPAAGWRSTATGRPWPSSTGRGSVRAYAGALARPVEGLPPRDDGPGASLALDVVPASDGARLPPGGRLQQGAASGSSYGSLMTLALAAAIAGAVSTVRFVWRSLELAKMSTTSY